MSRGSISHQKSRINVESGLYFSGSNTEKQHCLIPLDKRYDFGSGDFSVSYFITKLNGSLWTHEVFGGSSTMNLILNSTSDDLIINLNSADLTSAYQATYDLVNIIQGNNYHIIVSRSGLDISIYVNGTLIGTSQLDTADAEFNFSGATRFIFGMRGSLGNNAIEGIYSHFCMFSGSVNPLDASYLYYKGGVVPQSLHVDCIAHYSMAERSLLTPNTLCIGGFSNDGNCGYDTPQGSNERATTFYVGWFRTPATKDYSNTDIVAVDFLIAGDSLQSFVTVDFELLDSGDAVLDTIPAIQPAIGVDTYQRIELFSTTGAVKIRISYTGLNDGSEASILQTIELTQQGIDNDVTIESLLIDSVEQYNDSKPLITQTLGVFGVAGSSGWDETGDAVALGSGMALSLIDGFVGEKIAYKNLIDYPYSSISIYVGAPPSDVDAEFRIVDNITQEVLFTEVILAAGYTTVINLFEYPRDISLSFWGDKTASGTGNKILLWTVESIQLYYRANHAKLINFTEDERGVGVSSSQTIKYDFYSKKLSNPYGFIVVKGDNDIIQLPDLDGIVNDNDYSIYMNLDLKNQALNNRFFRTAERVGLGSEEVVLSAALSTNNRIAFFLKRDLPTGALYQVTSPILSGSKLKILFVIDSSLEQLRLYILDEEGVFHEATVTNNQLDTSITQWNDPSFGKHESTNSIEFNGIHIESRFLNRIFDSSEAEEYLDTLHSDADEIIRYRTLISGTSLIDEISGHDADVSSMNYTGGRFELDTQLPEILQGLYYDGVDDIQAFGNISTPFVDTGELTVISTFQLPSQEDAADNSIGIGILEFSENAYNIDSDRNRLIIKYRTNVEGELRLQIACTNDSLAPVSAELSYDMKGGYDQLIEVMGTLKLTDEVDRRGTLLIYVNGVLVVSSVNHPYPDISTFGQGAATPEMNIGKQRNRRHKGYIFRTALFNDIKSLEYAQISFNNSILKNAFLNDSSLQFYVQSNEESYYDDSGTEKVSELIHGNDGEVIGYSDLSELIDNLSSMKSLR